MKQRYLEVTFRNGRPLAAYLYLPHPTRGKATRTTDAGHGLHVDFGADGQPIGVEITAPSAITIAQLNDVLNTLGVAVIGADEWRPLAA